MLSAMLALQAGEDFFFSKNKTHSLTSKGF
jgi:hypothetical protein